jgi:hypothetical protein
VDCFDLAEERGKLKVMIYWKIPILHIPIMIDMAGSTGPFYSGPLFPAYNDLIKAIRFCPVHFRWKLMKWQSFSVLNDID